MGWDTVIQAWACAMMPERAEAVLYQMENAGCPTNVATYAQVVQAWASVNRPERAAAVVAQMKASGIPIGKKCKNALRNAWFQHDRRMSRLRMMGPHTKS